jgi:phosphonate transport system substrate-binding protein
MNTMAFSSVIKSRKIIDTGYLVIILAVISILSLVPKAAFAQDTLTLSIQPIQSEERTREIFQPMADYISFLTGKKVELQTYPNFISFWSETQKGDKYDIVFDAAHFIDYRNKTHDFTVIAKQPGTVSISLIVPEESIVFDAEELVGKKISTLGPPSVAAVNIDMMYENPIRQPTVVEANNSQDVIKMLREGKTDAGMIPTPLVSSIMAGEGGINVVTTTEPVPSMAISLSPNVTADDREKLIKGFLDADKNPQGQKMLEGTNLNPFEKTTNQDYFGFSEMLDLL